jgi:hypothetical protein
VINDVKEGTFFARILLRMENELGKKIIEIDARPSDSIVLALQQQRPIYVVSEVLDSVEDMTEVLERVLKQQTPGPESPEEGTEDDSGEDEEGDEGDEGDEGEEGEEGNDEDPK